MSLLRIQPHGRLQEWVAHEKGYFTDEGLEYEFTIVPPDEHASGRGGQDAPHLSGAYELFREGQGRKGKDACDVSSACHWAVNRAAADRLGRMWGGAYSVVPGGIYVPPESRARRAGDLAGVEVAAGYHSGSHFAALRALEDFLPHDRIRLRFIGRPMARLDAALAREVAAVSAWGASSYVLEQKEFRKLADTTFMVGFLFPAAVEETDIERFVAALRRAQMDVDLAPERYKHYFLKELPARFHGQVDVRLFGVGERIVFLPYTKEMYEETQAWMHERSLFEESEERAPYESAVRR